MQEKIFEHATLMRGVLQRALMDAIKTEDTTNTCAYACVLLSVSLSKFFGLDVAFQGGDGNGDGGYVCDDGVSNGHYWIKATNRASGEVWVVDITADQFGGPPVVVEPLSLCEARYVPGDQKKVNDGMNEVMGSVSPHLSF